MEKENHSVLLYQSYLDDVAVEKITNWLQNGIKVLFFSCDPVEVVTGRFPSYFHDSKEQAPLLSVFEVRYTPKYLERTVTVYDGMIADHEWYQWICGTEGFNSEQYEVEHSPIDKHCLVKAGAGTGKTRTMVDRLLFLKHVRPETNFSQIAMVTFTNESAVEMRTRLVKRLQEYFTLTRQEKYLNWIAEVDDMQISTLHSFAKYILQEKGADIGIPPQMDIRSYEHRKQQLIEAYIHQFAETRPTEFAETRSTEFAETRSTEFAPFRLIPQYKMVKRIKQLLTLVEQRAVSDYSLLSFGTGNEELSALFAYVLSKVDAELKAEKTREKQWELSDLIRYLGEVTFPSSGTDSWLTYLFVDEFQDTDTLQVQFLTRLSHIYQAKLFVVGDLKQSIYRFRGADYTAYQQLTTILDQIGSPTYCEYSLTKNYRTDKKILDKLQPIFQVWGDHIQGFDYRKDDRLEAMIQDETAAGFVKVPLRDDDEELLSLLEKLETKMEQSSTSGEKQLECVLLVRTNEEVREVKERVEELGFRCHADVEGDFYRKLPVREFYLMMQVLMFPHDPVKRLMWHRSSYGVNTLTNDEIIAQFTPDKTVVLELLKQETAEDTRLMAYVKKLEQQPLFQVLHELIEDYQPADQYARRLYQQKRKKSPNRDIDKLKKDVHIERKEYTLNLRHLLILLQQAFPDTTVTFSQLLDYVQTQIATNNEVSALSVPAEERANSSFTCMTVHKAKGQEFDYVILPNTDRTMVQQSLMEFILRRNGEEWQVGYHFTMDKQPFHNEWFETGKSKEKQEIQAEETRLFYVALTRAKKGLYVYTDYVGGTSDKLGKWSDLLKLRGVEPVVQS